jgi:hypothetical protein
MLGFSETSSVDLFFLLISGGITVLKVKTGCFEAICEPSVRVFFNELQSMELVDKQEVCSSSLHGPTNEE